jgi:Ca2+/H+ antiporter, TMEM165/GDT1 family
MTGTVTSGGSVVLVTAVFLASAVEMVEALTIVLAVGVTKGWRTALEGAAAALATLTALVLLLGPALVHLVPLQALRLVVGGLLLVFGLQWLRKAILRASGLKAKHDEDAIFDEQVAELSAGDSTGTRRDSAGFVVAFKGVFLEGLEVVVVVLTLGSTSHNLGLAAAAAVAAVVVVSLAGLVVARQLSSVPENAMKMAVGLMLVSFGSFWSGEGVGVHWPGSDLAIPVLVGFYGLAAWGMVTVLKRAAAVRAEPVVVPAAGGHGA